MSPLVTSYDNSRPGIVIPPAPPGAIPRGRGEKAHRQQVPAHHRRQAGSEAAADAGGRPCSQG